MEKLESFLEQQAEKAEELQFCKGMKLLYIREQVKMMLEQIGKIGLFEEYTSHNIGHIDEMLKIAEWLIPQNTKEKMTRAEWLMLTLAIYFHDLGMVVTRDEYDKRNDNPDFVAYRNKVIKEAETVEYKDLANNNDSFLYQEYVRENHAIRISDWIKSKESVKSGGDTEVRKQVEDVLEKIDGMFKTDLAMICESHHRDDIDDFTKYKVNKRYGNTDDEKVNLNYIAIILRIADLLHITRDRTPSVTRKLINVRNPKSVIEWEKQRAVRAISPKEQRNEEGDVDVTIQKDTIEVTAYFDNAEQAEAYFGLSSYLQYARKELSKCYEIVDKAQKKEGTIDYKFPWREIDESQIEVIGFEKKKLQFTIAQDNILQLLVGHTLYNDSSVVVRELVQNGIDAVRLQIEYDKLNKKTNEEGAVWVEWNSNERQLSFWDNGTGMTLQDVENYLLKVGASKYRDEIIRKQFPNFTSISHFGIGLLTCFMVADDIDIVTKSDDQEEANSINLRKVNGSYLLQNVSKNELDDRIKEHGTMVKLYIRSDIDMSNVEESLQKWIIVPEVPVFYKTDGIDKRIGKDTLKEVLVNYLQELGYEVDGEHIDVIERKNENVSLAYAVKFSKYFSDWRLMTIPDIEPGQRRNLVGTCVEGIRVEFSTPGFKDISFLAIANIKNSKYQTNVARSAIDMDSSSEILSNIYELYKLYIEEQIEKLEQQDYSESWAMSEGYYLMQPLINANFHYYRNPIPIEESLLIQRLANVKCFILENDDKRKSISAEDVAELEEVNIFESEMNRAGEEFLKEVKSNATLSNLIRVACKSNYMSEAKNVLCNIDKHNMLHRFALRDKEVQKINISYNQRRIQLKYSNKNNRWYEYEIDGRTYNNVYIPKTEELIFGLKDEVGIKSFGDVYLRHDTELCRFLVKVINNISDVSEEDRRMILGLFFSFVFNTQLLEKEQ